MVSEHEKQIETASQSSAFKHFVFCPWYQKSRSLRWVAHGGAPEAVKLLSDQHRSAFQQVANLTSDMLLGGWPVGNDLSADIFLVDPQVDSFGLETTKRLCHVVPFDAKSD